MVPDVVFVLCGRADPSRKPFELAGLLRLEDLRPSHSTQQTSPPPVDQQMGQASGSGVWAAEADVAVSPWLCNSYGTMHGELSGAGRRSGAVWGEGGCGLAGQEKGKWRGVGSCVGDGRPCDGHAWRTEAALSYVLCVICGVCVGDAGGAVALLFERAAVLLLQYYQHEIGGARLEGGATRALTGMRAQSGGVHYLSPLRGKVGTQKRWKVEGAVGGRMFVA